MSLRAKGLYTLMRALPDNWNFSIAGLMTLSTDKKESTQLAIWELEKFGYLKRDKFQNDKGFFDYEYTLFHRPPTGFTNPMAVLPSKDSPSTVKPSDNKELNNQVLKDKEHIAPDEQVQDKKPTTKEKPAKKTTVYKSDHKDIAEVIHAMVAIDAKNKLYYNNTTQKKACDFLIQEYTLKTVLDVVAGIPKARMTVAYFPSITTPCELRDKWVKAFEAIVRDKKSKAPVVKIQSV